jgi:hypothetical protein
MYKEFYKNGITPIDFSDKNLNKVLEKIVSGNLKEKFHLQQKYPKTLDLRPNVIDYDPIFLEVLKKHKIKEVLKNVTLKDMSLFHVQVRVVKDNNSYMNWHRDTYYDSSKNLIGKAPHGIKIIYYPEFTNKNKDRLLYLLGSNRILFPNNSFDNQLFGILKAVKIQSSNNSDINGLHAVCPEEENQSSIRVIYSFLNKQQIIDDHSTDELHMKTMRLYESIC